ncbi:MAG: zinc ribbon domain-containing protein [Nannocystis sp.]|uniref:FmdB family zinc ribbon protein n=1 Tax=Nannocystis sp. TaxID=1962667 RepID=UPI0024251F06|nr:FmdB family zinc ribbon protein [Nannocystis sp.]MBK9755056.1 zinc ribbon domain-containing protein [Nannocystis sp.]
MPIYAYRCQNCGADAEYIQKFSDPPITECEKCGGPLERAVTAAAFHLKGGGWYKDGYASAKGEGKGEAKADGASESKPESKPAESKPAESKPASDSGGTTSTVKAASE